MGNRANSCTAKSTREKTDKSSGKREARTTEDDIAAFMDKTDVSLLACENESVTQELIANLSWVYGPDFIQL